MILQCCNFEVFRVEGASCNDIKWDILRDNQILSLITKKHILKKTINSYCTHFVFLCRYRILCFLLKYSRDRGYDCISLCVMIYNKSKAEP